ncbi:hypothetical protein BOTBODRAFT_146221 [Botryobasidium botryosum FD-172 SS1]|uniref:RmlD-like substrate binding domain-containing protein n=1 Tax=Botryobasidium botryosum (strain FD-172 SS1) TaxID=930990 RepID=A0A067MCU1_BOTB1|nr:hypothetical protein BOTBODRAFT_146221 [Botryobasidium botryosum FD-172 SS1]
MSIKIVVTGASGILGSAIFNALKKFEQCHVIGLAHSRPSPELVQLDILDTERLEVFLKEQRPDWVIHCAAERRPDIAEKPENSEWVEKLNTTLPATLSELSLPASKWPGFTLLHISTDYVFNGEAPPSGYDVNDPVCPLQSYGKSKAAAEEGVLKIRDNGGKSVVLRVPVLYGPTRENADTAINVLIDVVQSSKAAKMDNYAIRYPTNVLDIADFIVKLIESAFKAHNSPSGALPPILHFTSPKSYTKYDICLILARILGKSHDHIEPETHPANTVNRPKDCHLSMRVVTDDLGLSEYKDEKSFRDLETWFNEWLSKETS